MKKQTYIMGLLMAFSLTLSAQDKVFNAPEVSLEVLGLGQLGQEAAKGELIPGDAFGAGLGLSAFLFEKYGNQIGLNVTATSTDWTNIRGPFVDDARITLEVRRPVGDSGVALGVFFGEGYSFEKDDRYEAFGAKINLRTSKQWDFFFRVGYKEDLSSDLFGGQNSFKGHAFGEAGISFVPSFWKTK